jgi:hypothetical protein
MNQALYAHMNNKRKMKKKKEKRMFKDEKKKKPKSAPQSEIREILTLVPTPALG